MLKYELLHPEILGALAAAGHGSRVLLADANYPFATGARAGVPRAYLNLAPGLLPVTDVLRVLVRAIPVEAAAVMVPDAGPEPSVFAEFRALLPGLELTRLDRAAFYAQAQGADLALLIATGEQRLFANVLLTVGVVAASA
jgi:L-fucose mutarotase